MAISCIGNNLITGGKDKKLRVFPGGNIKKGTPKYTIPHYARGLDQNASGDILVGCRNGVVYELVNGKQTEITRGHSDGETWGLAIDPSNSSIMVTTCDDNKILVWDTNKRACIA